MNFEDLIPERAKKEIEQARGEVLTFNGTEAPYTEEERAVMRQLAKHDRPVADLVHEIKREFRGSTLDS